jgi:tyrosine-protein kinase Etk/Wzc
MVSTQLNPHVAFAVGVEEEDVVLGQLLKVVLADIWWLVAIAATVIATAGVYCYFAKPVYSADTMVRVEQSDSTSQLLLQVGEIGAGMAPLPTDAEIGIIESREVVAPVVREFKLDFSVTPKTFPVLGTLASYFWTGTQPSQPWLGLTSYAWGGEGIDVTSVDVEPALEGQKMVLTALNDGKYQLRARDGRLLLDGEAGETAQGGGVTIRVSRLIARPGTQFTVTRANDLEAIAAFQLAIKVEEQGKMTGLIDISLDGEDPQLAADMANALAQSYLSKHIASKQANASNMLDFLKSEEPRLKADLERSETALAVYQRQSGSINASDEAKIYLEGSVQYEQQISALRLQIAALQQHYGDQNPLIKVSQQQMTDLEAQRDKYSGRFRDLPATEVKAVQLQRDAKVAEVIYELVLTREQELAVQKAGTGGNVHMVDEAMRPGRPIKPKKLLILSAATMLGLIIGTGFIFVRRNLFKGIDDPERIERTFRLPIFGLVPLSPEQALLEGSGEQGADQTRSVLADVRPKDACIESLRSLRTSMQFTMMDARNRVVMLTGAVPGIGKSFLSVNLAVLLARSGKRVLMIDADMRRGALERYIGSSQHNGLSELLSGQISLEEAIRSTSIDGLSFISCGRRPPNPSELLMSPRLPHHFECLAEHYDVILIDTPPVLAVTDASIIGAHAGSTFFVMRSGVHSEAEIGDALKRLKVAGVQVQGGIFNAMPPRTRGTYGYHAVQEYLST